AVAAFPSYYALLLRARTSLDDSLDVVAAHGVGGCVGAPLTGVLSPRAWDPGGGDGALLGNPKQFGIQVIPVLGTIAYSVAGTFVVLKLVQLASALRTNARDEGLGLDFTQHGEEAYSRGEGAILLLDGRSDS